MSSSFADDPFAARPIAEPRPTPPGSAGSVANYGLALLFVALATALAFLAQNLVSAPNITLIYVLPVIISATLFGWGPSLAAVAASVAAFDFFFTAPYYSFSMSDPSDVWAAILLFVIASIVTSVSAQSRRRALEAAEAAEEAQALHALAHSIIEGRPQSEIVKDAAGALHRIFRAPAVVFVQREERLEAAAAAGGAEVTATDREAASRALAARLTTRGMTYPNQRTYFDFWPVSTGAGRHYVLGVDFAHATHERPPSTERTIEAVAAYIAAGQALRGSSP